MLARKALLLAGSLAVVGANPRIPGPIAVPRPRVRALHRTTEQSKSMGRSSPAQRRVRQ